MFNPLNITRREEMNLTEWNGSEKNRGRGSYRLDLTALGQRDLSDDRRRKRVH